jgi:hypothetical protein
LSYAESRQNSTKVKSQGEKHHFGIYFVYLHAPLTNWGLKLVDIQDGWTMLDNAGFIQTEIHRMKPSNATIIGVKA